MKLTGSANLDRHGILVIRIPESGVAFGRRLGVPAGSYAGIAAVAWPSEAKTYGESTEVVINPAVTEGLSDLGRNLVLTHEAVHVFTRSHDSAAPTWLTEGYADAIAYRRWPDARKPAASAVSSYVRKHGAPTSWPAEADFAVAGDRLRDNYDLAWSAVESISDKLGNQELNRFYARMNAGDSLASAARRSHSTEAELLRHWQTLLQGQTELGHRVLQEQAAAQPGQR